MTELTPDVIQLLRENENARYVLRQILEGGYTSKKYLGHEIPEGNLDKLIPQLKIRGILSVTEDGSFEFYALNDEILTVFDGVTCKNPNTKLRDSLSETIIYADADTYRAKILHENLGEKTILNGIEGVLIPENGGIYLISLFEDNAPSLSEGSVPIEMIRKSGRIPLNALREEGNNLTIGDTCINHSAYGKNDADFNGYYQLLHDKKATKISGNLDCEILI